MLVKIGETTWNSSDEPIMIILTSEEKKLLSNMGDQTKFCSFPKYYKDSILAFMEE